MPTGWGKDGMHFTGSWRCPTHHKPHSLTGCTLLLEEDGGEVHAVNDPVWWERRLS